MAAAIAMCAYVPQSFGFSTIVPLTMARTHVSHTHQIKIDYGPHYISNRKPYFAPLASPRPHLHYSSMTATSSSKGALAAIFSLRRSSRLLFPDRILNACSAE